MPKALALFLSGLLVGGLLGWMLRPERGVPSPGGDLRDRPDGVPAICPLDAPASAAEEASPHEPAPAPAQASHQPSPRPSTGGPATAPGGDEPARPPTAPATRAALIAARAESLRQKAADAVERARALDANAEAWATEQVDQELAQEAARRADLEHGGLLDLVRGLAEDWVPPLALLSSTDELAPYFQRREAGGSLGLERANAAPGEIGHGDVLQVPSGVSFLDVQAWNRATRAAGFPRDLLVEGMGIDRSLLVLNDELDVSSDVVNLTFRDLTVHCHDNYFVELRGGFTLRLDRCRIVGFDMGAGGSTAFNGDQGALYATESRIEAGFGRSPFRGNLWRIQGPFLARLERCTIVGPIGDCIPRSSGLVVYDDVTFVDLDEPTAGALRGNARTVRLLGCRFERSEEGPDVKRRQHVRREVSELNPAWVLSGERR